MKKIIIITAAIKQQKFLKLLLFSQILFFCLNVQAQGIYIKDTTGQVSITSNLSAPASSAKLDIVDTARGLLIPRMTTTQRNNISSPAAGLLIYNTTTNYFDFYSSSWTKIATYNSDANNNTLLGTSALSSNTTGYSNTAIGSSALFTNTTGWSNTALGKDALYFNTTGWSNTALGDNALYSNTVGSYNTALGFQALTSNISGDANTATGREALVANTTGYDNTATGFKSMYSNITGYNNTAAGEQSLNFNTTGFNNTANGFQSLYTNVDGNGNTGLGYQSLYANSNGDYNTSVGYASGNIYSDENYCTFLGYTANVNAATLSNCVAIGGNGNLSISADNTVRIGNSSMSSIGGQVSWTTVSDERVKENVKEDVKGLDFILKLKPITYTYSIGKYNLLQNKNAHADYVGKNEIEKIRFSGFSAQEVEKAAKESGYEFSGIDNTQVKNGGIYGLRYSDFVVPLVKGMQEQQQIIERQQLAISNLQKENEIANARIKNLEEIVLGTSAKK